MTSEQASYLTSLPLVLHVPALHLFVTHAGMLPSDPTFSPTDPRQPLAHKPSLSLDTSKSAEGIFQVPAPVTDLPTLRFHQESALLTDVPQNTEPFTVLNIRSVTKKHKVTRKGDKGTPWSKLWNAQMHACRGFDGELPRDEDALKGKGKGKDKEDDIDLPCYPATVVYGHAATRGLDIKRWSVGIDTGCLYGGKLTALVLRNGTASGLGVGGFDDDEDDEDDEDGEDDEDSEDEDESGSRPRRKKLQFGDPDAGIDAKLFSIRCPDLDD